MIQAETRQAAQRFAFGWSDFMMAGFVLMLIGYFLPWFKLPSVGLTLIGLDISEWLKFLPQFETGELPNRNWFYFPPICLGAMVILWSALTDAEGRRGSVMSGLGLVLALIAMPALEVMPINGEKIATTGEWLFRFVGIGLVGLLAVGRPLLARIPSKLIVGLIGIIGLVSAYFPARLLYLSRSAYIFWLRLTPNPGLGFMLHMLAVLAILAGTVQYFRGQGT